MKRSSYYTEIIDKYVVGGTFKVFDNMAEHGFETRDGQVDMSLDIAEAIRDGENLIVEAGVGIGKSFAYLFPSVLATQTIKRPIVIASSTIHLTEQLEQDVKDVEKIMNTRVSVIVGKGQRNYYCEDRSKKFIPSKIKDDEVLTRYIQEYPNTEIELTNEQWDKVNVVKCSFNQCKHRFNCDFYNMRQGLNGFGHLAGDIIIVNQDLLLRNYLKENRTGRPFINSRHEIVIIDEAHNLEEKARNALTVSFTKKEVLSTIEQFEKVTGNIQRSLREKINQFYKAIEKDVKKEDEEFDQIRSRIKDSSILKYKVIIEQIKEVYNSVQVMDMQKGNVSEELIESLDSLVELYSGIFKQGESNNIYWAEIERGKLKISFAPEDIAQQLYNLLFNQQKQFILTSATLSAGKDDADYKYLRESIGLRNVINSPSKESPFPYDQNSRLYLPQQAVSYEDPNYIEWLSNEIINISNATQGRTMVLFTAKKEMLEVYHFLKNHKDNKFHTIVQSNKKEHETLREFRESKGILLASGTYWEGLNIKGSDLTSLIISRLPFPVPDPIIENKMSNSSDQYNEVLLPEMIIKLKQGVGRLIRSANDIGLLSILDHRLVRNSKYRNKNKILESIPIQIQVSTIDGIKEFLESSSLVIE